MITILAVAALCGLVLGVFSRVGVLIAVLPPVVVVTVAIAWQTGSGAGTMVLLVAGVLTILEIGYLAGAMGRAMGVADAEPAMPLPVEATAERKSAIRLGRPRGLSGF